MNIKNLALNYHSKLPKGKIKIYNTKSLKSEFDLSLAYSPGVSWPCIEIYFNKNKVFEYTIKGNLVGIISNGTAVLGLGNIGPEASKPVMEGKSILFKFAGINAFDIEINVNTSNLFIQIVKSLEPTFGGINLEDIKSPECFQIESKLQKIMNIPIMHDDQHGTAIVSSAALINALELVNKKIENVKIVVSGAGAAAIACIKLYLQLGAKKKNIIMCDSNGVIRKDRKKINNIKFNFATDYDIYTITDAIKESDVFLGLSVGNIININHIKSMANNPIVFALSNPNPEISYQLATSCRNDIIVATGRSDYPNQVNNLISFPYIFRGALDVRLKVINDKIKLASVKALSNLAKKPVLNFIKDYYNDFNISFGRKYIIPKPIDPRLLNCISSAIVNKSVKFKISNIF